MKLKLHSKSKPIHNESLIIEPLTAEQRETLLIKSRTSNIAAERLLAHIVFNLPKSNP